jgi:hypothetical protein
MVKASVELPASAADVAVYVIDDLLETMPA